MEKFNNEIFFRDFTNAVIFRLENTNLENTNQSHCRTKIEKINKRRISQSALGQKQFEQINECQTVKIDLKSKQCS